MMDANSDLDCALQRHLFEQLLSADSPERERIISELWETCLPLVDRFVASSMKKDSFSGGLLSQLRDDLFSECVIVLRKAIEEFDVGRGVPFEGYVWPLFRGARTKLLRDAKKYVGPSLDSADPDYFTGKYEPPPSPDEVELPDLGQVRSALPSRLTEAKGWEAFCQVMLNPHQAGVLNRWRVRSGLALIGDEMLSAPQESVLPRESQSIVRIVRRARLWRAFAS